MEETQIGEHKGEIEPKYGLKSIPSRQPPNDESNDANIYGCPAFDSCFLLILWFKKLLPARIHCYYILGLKVYLVVLTSLR